MSGDDNKKKILARRARFVAAALASAGLGAAGCGGTTAPDPASDAAPPDGGADAVIDPDTGPKPCLTPMIDSGSGTDTATSDAGVDTGPSPCLSPPLDGG